MMERLLIVISMYARNVVLRMFGNMCGILVVVDTLTTDTIVEPVDTASGLMGQMHEI